MPIILSQVKEYIGVDDVETIFDTELLILINLGLSRLYSIGVEELSGIVATAASEYVVIEDQIMVNYIDSYIPLSVKVVFDISANTSVQSSRVSTVLEIEHRIQYRVAELERQGV
jgi:hypothetical protein